MLALKYTAKESERKGELLNQIATTENLCTSRIVEDTVRSRERRKRSGKSRKEDGLSLQARNAISRLQLPTLVLSPDELSAHGVRMPRFITFCCFGSSSSPKLSMSPSNRSGYGVDYQAIKSEAPVVQRHTPWTFVRRKEAGKYATTVSICCSVIVSQFSR